MKWTIMPAGTTGSDERDAAVIAQIVEAVGGLEVRWAAQIVCPDTMWDGESDRQPQQSTPAGQVRAAIARGAMLPRLDDLYINDEVGLPHLQRADRMRRTAFEVWRQTRRGPAGAYGTPRARRDNGLIDDPCGWAHELYAAGLRTACPSTYLWEDRVPELGPVLRWAEANGVGVVPYLSGQMRGDGDPVPADLLHRQRTQYEGSIEAGVLWCNIRTPGAVAGVRRVLEVWS